MPQLPSGKHVAVQFDSSIISHLNEPKASSVPWVMALQQPEDLYRWLLVYYLQPDHGGSAINAKEFHSRSSSPPENHLLIPTGMRLSQWEKLTNEWSAEDKKSMRDWMEGPMYECLVQPMLEQAKWAQQWLESSNEFMVKTSVLWWKAGVHYAQEEQWEPDDPEQFDCYDL
ncbi:MAG: hypothetical protein IT470_05370, partial [Pseudomonadales bacterium]|nr:hypothetical protein [Pseudomonadales bacterium]